MIPQVAAVDKRGMADHDLLFDMLSEPNLLVLRAYASRSLAARAANHEHDGWLQRLEPTDDLDGEQLTKIHGDLIALGMLKFELTNRETGLRYRVSDRGNSTLERQSVTVTAEIFTRSAEISPAVESAPAYSLADAA